MIELTQGQLNVIGKRILDSLFPAPDPVTGDVPWAQQRRLTLSGAKRIAVCCTRRAAKTMSVAARHLIRCITKPGANCLYLNMFGSNVRRDYYESSIKVLLRRAGYRGSFPARLPLVFSNGSRIEGAGLDNAHDANKKMRGGQWDEIDIDEVQSWDSDVEDMIHSVLQPMVRERRGTIVVSGTPGDVHGGFWHRLAMGDIPGWETFGWSWRDNVYTRDSIQAELDLEIAADPDVVLTPAWRRENEGEWVIEDDLRVYKHGQHNLNHDSLPGLPDDYIWGIGMDTGSNNDSSIVEMAYPRSGAQKVFITWAWKQPGLDFLEFGERIKERCDLRQFNFKVIDPAAKQGVETIINRFGIFLTSAQKGNQSSTKKHHIDVMNGDLRRGTIQVLPEAREALCGEWDRLVWDRRLLEKGEYHERSGMPNHCADGALYAHRECRHFWSHAKGTPPLAPIVQALPTVARDNMTSDDVDAQNRRIDEQRLNRTRGIRSGMRLL